MIRVAALSLALLLTPARAAPAAGDVDRAAMRVAGVLDGVVRNCPGNFAQIGTAQKKCVGVSRTVEAARVRLGAALGADLYGVWRSRDEQRSVFNWLWAGQAYVFVRLQPDPDGRARTLVYLDVPPPMGAGAPAAASPGPAPTQTGVAQSGVAQIGGVVLTPVQPGQAGAAQKPAPPADPAALPPDQPSGQAAAPGRRAPVPFDRTLQLQSRRLSGPDVLAVQNRLIALMRPARSGHGDGWYGPVTAGTVRAFQQANGLGVTGRVDRETWNRLFSAAARPFDAPALP